MKLRIDLLSFIIKILLELLLISLGFNLIEEKKHKFYNEFLQVFNGFDHRGFVPHHSSDRGRVSQKVQQSSGKLAVKFN